MPFKTLRSFTRGKPSGLLGNSGSITRHSKSVRSHPLMRSLNQVPPQEEGLFPTTTIAGMRPVDDNAAMTVLRTIQSLARLFHSHCADTDTLEQLDRMTDDRGSWLRSRQLFDAIRAKNLKAERRGDRKAAAQYCFEEVCAKTLYNLTMQSAPYDPDTPYWIVPNALSFAKELGLSPNDVVAIINPARPS